jgi:hypothetical protein
MAFLQSSKCEELSSDEDNNNFTKHDPATVTTIILGDRTLIFRNGLFKRGEISSEPIEISSDEGEDSSNPIEISSDESEDNSNPIEISSDEAEDSSDECKTLENTSNTPKTVTFAVKPTEIDVYDPAEALPIATRTVHYFALGQRMGSYTERRLRRIVGDMGASQEEYTEAQYQLQMRF